MRWQPNLKPQNPGQKSVSSTFSLPPSLRRRMTAAREKYPYDYKSYADLVRRALDEYLAARGV